MGGLVFFAALLFWVGQGDAETDLQKIRSGVAQSKKELGGLKKKIQEEKQRVKAIHKKESSVISQLNKMDRNLSEKEKELKVLNRKLEGVVQKVRKTNEELQLVTQSVETQEAFLEKRLVALYKFGETGMPQIFFSSNSYAEFLNSRRYLASILGQDRELVEDFRKRQTVLGSYREQLKEDERELQALKEQTEKKQAEIRKDRLQKGRLLDSVRGEKRIHLAAIKELETASAQLQTLLNRLEREIREKAKAEVFIPAGKGFGTFRGKLAFPVEGRILSTFGKNENPKFNTFTVQKGIEIEAAIGAEIRAVYDGRVLYSDWFKGYGKILIIDHGEGYYTLSGHASALLKNVGEEVRGGEGVALVGDTGSLKGPCLYFEIRQRGKPLDPLEWLAHPRVR
ncbi:MAG: peptidoglycan DD-metalloendopeptidase family protein [Deltaproteobacteria bacterium]|nr:peptidoglycan DD-metalloendopeptidase family protein [Deltaproteobacteria bacterium]MDO9211768.1 peptidoglycan DD-metalloendopeptidase family protein [Deltaproteobacteria bacterium]